MKSKISTEQKKLFKDINAAMEKCGTAAEHEEFIKRQEVFHQMHFGEVVNLANLPTWDATIYIYDEDTWYEAVNYLLYLDYPKDWIEEIYLEEIDHYREAEDQGLTGTFVLRFFKNPDESISCEPAVITFNEDPREDYGERMQKVINAPKSNSDWDKDLLKIAKKWKKKSKV